MTEIYRNIFFNHNQFTGSLLEGCQFINCSFVGVDLTETQFINCMFYNRDTQNGCDFTGATLKDTSFKKSDLSVCLFKSASALGMEIRESKVQGADFRGASFMNLITTRTWFCSAYITKCNLSYSNFSGVILERCELWENRWNGTNVAGADFCGSDLSGGGFSDFDWCSVNVTNCDLTNSELGELDLRNVNLEGCKLDSHQVSVLMEKLGIVLL